MKKTLIVILLTLAAAAIVTAVYRFGFRKSIPDASPNAQVVAILEQNDCFVCHSGSPKLPFYANFPIIGKRMAEHARHAVDFVNLDAAMADTNSVSEVTVSMIEHSVITGAMPIHEYRMIHWGTGFSNTEKAVLASWIRDKRVNGFSNGLSCDVFAAEAVFPIPYSIPADSAKAELGYRMYNDTRLSHDGTISCATCHVLEENGADYENERTSEGIYGLLGGVNAPTVYNSWFNVRQFWNGRAADLQEQAAGPPTNPVEMGCESWDEIVGRLREDKALVKEFEALYPGEGITQASMTDAIAEFEKTLLTPDSRFDLLLKGDKSAVSDEEFAGYKVFKENACATCHTGVILGGKSFEKLGIYGDYFADRDTGIEYNSDDDGLKGFTGNEADLHKYKVPGLRNVELTAPYFHDGTMLSLEDAVRAMAKYELGKNMKDEDVNAIVAFMKTLTGKNAFLEPAE